MNRRSFHHFGSSRQLVSALAACLISSVSASLGDTVGNELAARFSPRLQEIGNEAAQTRFSISSLPKLPTKDLGGWGVFARIFETDEENLFMDFKWSKPAVVDMIALVPSIHLYPAGVDLNYGVPKEFTVQLIDEAGITLPVIATEVSEKTSHVRRGHPFVYRLANPVRASGMRIQIHQLSNPPLDTENYCILSWSEIFCFSGNENVAENAEVSYNFDDAPGDTWTWRRQLLVDGQTPLGLPEKRTEEVKHIGWLSASHSTSEEVVWVQVDLGQEREFDTVRLFPALRPTLDEIPGFGLPLRFQIQISDSGLEGSFRTAFDQSAADYDNPGQNPVTLRIPTDRARFVRLNATKLWKPFTRYPAFLALSEIQVLRNENNLALHAPVTASESTEIVAAHNDLVWSGQSLTNGCGPSGNLLGTREWIEQLDAKLQLELKLHDLGAEATEIRSSWSRNSFGLLAFFGWAGIFAACGIPVFFRIRERKRLREMRNWIAGDLHDEIGSNLGSIQVLSNLLKQEHPGADETASTIGRVAAETVNSVRDIVWLLRPQDRETAHTIDHLRDTAAILLEPMEWSFETDITGDDLLLDHAARRNLMLFFRETLHNISRHALATHVRIRLTEIDHRFHLSISDNGVGIPDDLQRLPRFLRALKERAKRLAGHLEFDSGANRGTTLVLIFPAPRNLRFGVVSALMQPRGKRRAAIKPRPTP